MSTDGSGRLELGNTTGKFGSVPLTNSLFWFVVAFVVLAAYFCRTGKLYY